MAQRRHQIYTLRRCTSARRGVPSYRLNSCGLQAFSVLGPRLWNSLPRLLRDTGHNTTRFGHSLKTFFSESTSAYSALGALAIMRYTNLRFTYLFIYSCVSEASRPRWGEWGAWSMCSSSCGDGVQTRRRQCVNPSTGNTVGSQLCYGRDQEQKYCKGVSCPGQSIIV